MTPPHQPTDATPIEIAGHRVCDIREAQHSNTIVTRNQITLVKIYSGPADVIKATGRAIAVGTPGTGSLTGWRVARVEEGRSADATAAGEILLVVTWIPAKLPFHFQVELSPVNPSTLNPQS